MATRREYKGAAVPTRLTSGIGAADTSFGIVSNSGWPTGGANGPFTVILDPDVAGKEEAVLVSNQSAGSCTGVTRGIDDTAATTHGVGADGSVIHGSTKRDVDEANRHITVTTDDDHTQYLNLTRHAAVVHTSGMLGTDSVGSVQIQANAVTSSELADNAVDTTAIVDSAVTSAKIADLTIVNGDIAATTITGGKLVNGTIAQAQMGNDSIGSPQIIDGALDNLLFFLADLFTLTHNRASPGAARSTSSTTYVNWPTVDTFSVSHTKKIAGSRILVLFIGSAYFTGGNNSAFWAVRVDAGADTELFNYFFSALNDHRPVMGAALLTGISAGAHTYNLRARVVGNTLNADSQDSNQLIILELP